MPITSPIFVFTDLIIRTCAPAQPGVYALYQRGELIYYGSSTSIRDRLLSHYRGVNGRCTQSATHFNFEITSRYLEREAELLREYKRVHGRLPRCNEVMPS